MVKQLFSIQDIKVKVFYPPMTLLNVQEATRVFADLVCDQSTSLSKHPEDFRLFSIGTFDDNEGVILSLTVPDFIANALDFVKRDVIKEV